MVELSIIENYTPLMTFGFALLVGLLHVVLGPDHVTAVVALSSGVKRREHDESSKYKLIKKSSLQGFRWGAGHTIGLGFMTGIFMIFRDNFPIDAVSKVSDNIVGSLMIILGVISLYNLYLWNNKENEKIKHMTSVDDDIKITHSVDGIPIEIVPGSEAHVDAHRYAVTHVHSLDSDMKDSNTMWKFFRETKMGENFSDNERGAYVMGMFHGISGLSGIIYVLPALFVDDSLRLGLYLLGFFFSSILSMTILGGLLGIIPNSKKYIMATNLIAGIAVIGIGMMWLILTSQDKLDL